MMLRPIPIVDGNLLDADVDVLIHQANCQGTMGSGIALQLKNAYPEVYKADLAFELPLGKPRLGEWSVANVWHHHTGKPLQVINAYGQVTYGRGKHTNEKKLLSILDAVFKQIADYEKLTGTRSKIGVPYRIGCARGGGDWDTVLEGMMKLYNQYDVDLVLYRYNG